MSTLQIDDTSKAEALHRIPSLRPSTGPYGGRCEADECFATAISNSRISDAIFIPVATTHNQALYSKVNWLGLRYWNFNVLVELRHGKVSEFEYHLMTLG